MEFETEIRGGEEVWAMDHVEDEEYLPEILVDEFLWPVINALAMGQDLRTNPTMLEAINRALTTKESSFVFRLGNLGMTYDPDLLEDVEDDVLETDTFADMLNKLREIYVVHEEEQALQLLDLFMSRASPCVVLHMPLNAVLGY